MFHMACQSYNVRGEVRSVGSFPLLLLTDWFPYEGPSVPETHNSWHSVLHSFSYLTGI